MSVTLGHVLLLLWPWVHTAPQKTRALFSAHDFKCSSASPSPTPKPSPFAQVTLNDVSVTSLDQCDVPWAPSFEADSLSSKTSLICGQVNSFHPSRLTFNVWLLQHGCFPTDVDQSSATLSCSVFISTFLKREASKWEGLLSYFFPPNIFVFNCFPMETNVSSLTHPPLLFWMALELL